MNKARASGAPVVTTLGGVKRSFRRLTQRELGILIERMPAKDAAERMFYGSRHIHGWAATPAGNPVVLAMASLPVGHSPEDLDARIAEIQAEGSGWGSSVSREAVAALVVAETLCFGDEEKAGEGEQRPDPTTSGTT